MVRRDEFHQTDDDRLPGVASLLDGVSRHASIEADEQHDDVFSDAESHLLSMATSVFEALPSIALPAHVNEMPDTLRNFKEACNL